MIDYLLDGLKHAAGCYLILNTANNKKYVGKTRDLAERAREHRKAMALDSRDFTRIPSKMQDDVFKYPPETFEFYPLCYCDLERLELNERTLMQALKPEYNTSSTAHYTKQTNPEQLEIEKRIKWAKGMLKATEGRTDAWALGMRRAARHKLREIVESADLRKKEYDKDKIEALRVSLTKNEKEA